MADDITNDSKRNDSIATTNGVGLEEHAEEIHAATTDIDPEHPMLIVVMVRL